MIWIFFPTIFLCFLTLFSFFLWVGWVEVAWEFQKIEKKHLLCFLGHFGHVSDHFGHFWYHFG